MATLADMVTRMEHRLAAAQGEINEDFSYYNSEHRLKAIGVSVPPEMRNLLAQVGWPRMYVDAIEERLDLEGFRLAGESQADDRLWSWWQENDLDVESGLAHTDALVHGRTYVTVSASPDEGGSPIIRAESPKHMWADIDPHTRQVSQAVRMYQSPDSPDSDGATLFLPDRTVMMVRGKNGQGRWTTRDVIQHNLGVVPVVPIINRERLSDRYGHSEISPELRSVTDASSRIMMNMQATAELMAVPQRLLFGVAQDALAADPNDKQSVIEAYFARIIAVEDSDAHATQFTAAELRNFTEVLQELAKQAASYTGLPPQYLSFNSDNPASAEAIRSSESRLVKKCERKARLFGNAWERVMRMAMLVTDGSVPAEAHRMESLWRDPATPTFAAKADAVTKLYNNGQGVIPKERARIDLGYSVEERKQMNEWDQESPMVQLAALYGDLQNSGGDETE